MDKSLKTHRQCDAGPTVTFPVAGHHRRLTGTELYCLVTEVHVCEQLAQGCYLTAERPGLEPATFWVGVLKRVTSLQEVNGDYFCNKPPVGRRVHMDEGWALLDWTSDRGLRTDRVLAAAEYELRRTILRRTRSPRAGWPVHPVIGSGRHKTTFVLHDLPLLSNQTPPLPDGEPSASGTVGGHHPTRVFSRLTISLFVIRQ